MGGRFGIDRRLLHSGLSGWLVRCSRRTPTMGRGECTVWSSWETPTSGRLPDQGTVGGEQ